MTPGGEMSKFFLPIFVMTLSITGFSYRFICNGILADGTERLDTCGLCDTANAARWDNPNLAVVVDKNPRPRGLSVEAWQDITAKSFKAWEDVSGSDLRFVPVSGQNPRQFGGHDVVHEIFWITKKDEWRKLVGTGEFGTLGATLPRYTCGGDQGTKRAIFDADLVLNGMDHINWQVECESDDCISVQTTLVHELGHFFGLDHPCLLCDTSIMSARAGFDLKFPVFDDMEGLRALYPSTNKGGFGSACTTVGNCASGLDCINDGVNRYCSKKCDGDSNCDMGASCVDRDGNTVCSFVSGKEANLRDVGQSCSRVGCKESLICAGAVEDHFYCYAPCMKSGDCRRGQQCVRILDGASLCLTLKSANEPCKLDELCEGDSLCHLTTGSATGVCRKTCLLSKSDYSQCDRGETCRVVENGQALCMPRDGELSLGEASARFGNRDPFFGPPSLGGGCSVKGDASVLSIGLMVFALAFRALKKRKFRQL